MFRIGDFSRLARVTIKLLHHYDEAGLLQPLHVDRQTGYRYYDASQLPTLHRILLMKDLGFSLEQIRHLVDASAESLSAALEVRQKELAASIAGDRARLMRLEALRSTLENPDASHHSSVLLRQTPAIEVYAVRQRVPCLGAPIQSLFEAAESTVAAENARSSASPFTIFHDPDYREQEADVEICIPVKHSVAKLGTHVLPRCEASASVTYRGPYEQTPLAYSQLLDWMSRSGMRLAGPVREIYHRYGADQVGYSLPAAVLATSSTEFVTELQAPVAPI